MGFKCGIVGLPNVGKSTIFNALTKAGAASENYPFCTIDPNVGIVDVPDKRLGELDAVIKSQRVVPSSMEFVDIAGLVKGASKGEGLGNKFLANIRETDAIAHVVRCFDDGDVVHVDGSINPVRDIETINAELIFADNETVEKGLLRYKKLAKQNKKEINATIDMLEALNVHLQELKPARKFPLEQFVGDVIEVQHAYRDLHLISSKKVVYVCNVEEDLGAGDDDNEYTAKVKSYAKNESSEVVILSGKIEEELSQLSHEKKTFKMYQISLACERVRFSSKIKSKNFVFLLDDANQIPILSQVRTAFPTEEIWLQISEEVTNPDTIDEAKKQASRYHLKTHAFPKGITIELKKLVQ